MNWRGGFVNSKFPSKANFPQKSNSTYDKKYKSKSLRNFEISNSMSRKLQRNGALPRATGPPLSALIKEQHKLHKKPFPWLGESTDENKALLFFTGWEAEFKVLAIPHNPLDHCLRKYFLTAIWFAMFENSVKIKLLHMNWSVKTVN